jgi:hypothetical protein
MPKKVDPHPVKTAMDQLCKDNGISRSDLARLLDVQPTSFLGSIQSPTKLTMAWSLALYYLQSDAGLKLLKKYKAHREAE